MTNQLEEISAILHTGYLKHPWIVSHMKQKVNEGFEYIDLPNFKMSTIPPHIITPKSDENWRLRCKSRREINRMGNAEVTEYFRIFYLPRKRIFK
jgi:hypothetical protein